MAWILIVTTAIPVALAHSEQIHQIDGRHYINCVFSSDQEMWSLLWFQVSQITAISSIQTNYYGDEIF